MRFILEFFVLITGIGAASGLSYKQENNQLFIVSDNSNYFYEYHIGSKTLDKHLLVDMDGKNEQVKKKQKLDFEAIAEYNGLYHLSSSGSKPNRNMMFDVDPTDFSFIGENNLVDLYTQLQHTFDISEEDFNIEGAAFHNDTLLLFNRGNGPNEINGIIKIPKNEVESSRSFTPISLPKINGQTTGFTDATIVDGKIFFLAAAEGGKSSYDDGKIGGSQIGIIDLNSLTLEKTETISLEHKFEGITLYQDNPEEYIFLLCDDPDNDGNESTIYQLMVGK